MAAVRIQRGLSSLRPMLAAKKAKDVVLTRDLPSYKHLQRGAFGRITDADLTFFESIARGRVITDPTQLDAYNEDWMRQFKGSSQVVIRPKSTQEVSAILKYCNEKKLAVNPQGGNTGLVGGSVPVFDEVIISMGLMNKIINFDTMSRILTCEAGCILEALDNELAKKGFMMPLDLGAKGTCQIGGNVSTNAGGLRLLRYGSLHGTVLGLEAVLPNGEILNNLSSLRKDNTGYDLKQLFIGAEGTLGIVTGVAIEVPQRPQSVNLAFFSSPSYEKTVETFLTAKRMLGEILSAFEFFDGDSMLCSTRNMGYANPLGGHAPFFILVETHGSVTEHDQAKLSSFLEHTMEKGLVSDGTIADDSRKLSQIWRIRESLAEASKRDGNVYKYDVSLPVPVLYQLVEEMKPRVEGLATACIGYGHLGDGNLHLNITSKEHSEELLHRIEPFVYEFTSKHGGSISAEHGLGVMKPDHIWYSKSKVSVDVMRGIKKLLDPNGIMNPYKTIPATDDHAH